MVDTSARRAAWPSDMRQASVPGADLSGLEGAAAEAVDRLRAYVRSNPESAALWALGIGFVLGWKLKPW